MFSGQFFDRHPAWRDALLWMLPALVFGAVLRAMLLSYSPYALWGPDSMSFYEFAYKAITRGEFFLNEKRRYLYPLFLHPISLLPGEPLKWAAWAQHALGLVSVLAVAYVVRKTFVSWRLLIIPATLLFAGLPQLITMEHWIGAEALFVPPVVWIVAGWVAVLSRVALTGRPGAAWWLFLIPLAVFMLTKPAGRFFWPGVVLALLFAQSWRFLRWHHWLALVLVLAGSLSVYKEKQAATLLYASTFPFTQIDSPLHAEYKEDFSRRVRGSRRNLKTYYTMDWGIHLMLKNPRGDRADSPWHGLDDSARIAIYQELAREALVAEPLGFLGIAGQRMLGSVAEDYQSQRAFDPDYAVELFEPWFNEYAEGKKRKLLDVLFRLEPGAELPDYETFSQRLSPAPDSALARWLAGYIRHAREFLRLLRPRDAIANRVPVDQFRPEPIAVWLVAGMFLCLLPAYFKPLGAWALGAMIFSYSVFLVGLTEHRLLIPMIVLWPIFLCVPVDAAARLSARLLRSLGILPMARAESPRP